MASEENKSTKKSKGRKLMPDKEKLSNVVCMRFSNDELKPFSDKLKITSNVSRISELLKNIILNRKIVVYTRDKDLDIILSEVNKLRNEMNAIGKNFNQIAKRINTYEDQFLYKREFVNIEKHFEQFIKIQKELVYKFDLLAEKWLQK